jgi:membrane fusion protein, multidrug efflux system
MVTRVHMAFPRGALALSALLLFGNVASCKGGSGGPGRRGGPVPVVIAPVEARDVPIEIRAVGSAEAIHSVEVIPQVGGLLQAVHFKEGQAVRKGDLLFTIDTRPYRASLNAAQADLAKSRALADQAKKEVDRYQKLAKEGLASEQELSQVRANAAALEASLSAGRAAVTSNSLNVNFASIRSPIDGRTGSLLVHAGNVVKANDTRPLVVIRSIAPIYVHFAVPEQYLPAVRRAFDKGPVEVMASARGDGGHGVKGTLTFIENTVDVLTGKIDMKGEFQNENETLWPGQFVDVVLTTGTEPGAVVVPEAAVQTGQDGAYTYVVADGRALLRRVEIGRTLGEIAVIKRGLSPGEKVVTDGQVRLRDGSEVEIKSEPAPHPTASAEPAAPSAAGSGHKPVGEAER